jgi:hypothetical protein
LTEPDASVPTGWAASLKLAVGAVLAPLMAGLPVLLGAGLFLVLFSG